MLYWNWKNNSPHVKNCSHVKIKWRVVLKGLTFLAAYKNSHAWEYGHFIQQNRALSFTFLSLCLSLSLSLTHTKQNIPIKNGVLVLGIPGHSATPPKRCRNAARRPHGQLRAIVGHHCGKAVGSTAGGGGSGPSLLHGSEDPESARIPNSPSLRIPFPPLCPDRFSSRFRSLRSSRWSQQSHCR